jgi:RHS repeat-associated protein
VLGHPEFGQTVTRADGAFDLAVNGAPHLTVACQAAGFLPVHRQLKAVAQNYAHADPIVMLPLDPAVTTLTMAMPTFQVAHGSMVTDTSGSRQPAVVFPPDTTATLTLPDGTTAPADTLSVRVTEFTVGPNGAAAMPAPLPPFTGYTYAAEFSADEAIAAGATAVTFSAPVITYVDNFLGFPAGMPVPSGYYDRQRGVWVPSTSGLCIDVLSVSGGTASVDIDGTGLAATPTELAAAGISAGELDQIGAMYTAGSSLWRVPLPHFTPFDFNPANRLPPDAQAPLEPPPQGPAGQFPDCNSRQGGSIIGCSNRTVSEHIGVPGTTFSLNYISDRVPGHAATLQVPLTPASIPASMQGGGVDLHVGGRIISQPFAATPSLTTTVTWDGLDAYGRRMEGEQYAQVGIHYDYIPTFEETPRFAGPPGTTVIGVPGRNLVGLLQTRSLFIGQHDARSQGLGGWTLNVHHAYNAQSRVLYLGTGDQVRADALPPIITTVAGNGTFCGSVTPCGDGGPALQAQLGGPGSIAVGSDGSYAFADSVGDARYAIRHVDTNGVLTRILGQGSLALADGAPAGMIDNQNPVSDMKYGPDGTLYFAMASTQRVWRIGADGIVHVVAGTGVAGYTGDGGDAKLARLNGPSGIAIARDGSLYIGDSGNIAIRKLDTAGVITTVVGNDPSVSCVTGPPCNEGRRATALNIGSISNVEVLGDDSLVFTTSENTNGSGLFSGVGQLLLDGTFHTLAFRGGPQTDGIAVGQTGVAGFDAVAVAPDGNWFFASAAVVRHVGTDNIVTTLAGTGLGGFSGDNGPAPLANIGFTGGLAILPDGSLLLTVNSGNRIRRVASPLPGVGVSDLLIPSQDGAELFRFSSDGRHLSTFNTLTGATTYTFAYDAKGWLTSVTDGDGNVTSIARDTNHNPTSITGPFGQTSALAVDANGFLSGVTTPAGETYAMASTSLGLLQDYTDRRGNTAHHAYDTNGFLITDEDLAGNTQSLAATVLSDGTDVAVTTAAGRTEHHRFELLASGVQQRTTTTPDGLAHQSSTATSGAISTSEPDGSKSAVTLAPDPRYGMNAAINGQVIDTFGSLTSTGGLTRAVTLATATDPLSVQSLTDTLTDNGAVTTSAYDAPSKTLTITSPAMRVSRTVLDALGRPVLDSSPGRAPVSTVRDAQGRVTSVTTGTGAAARAMSWTYEPRGFLQSVTDSLGRGVVYVNDADGRPTSAVLPGGRVLQTAYDASGNIVSVTPPGGVAHTLAYSPDNLLTTYTPPAAGPGTGPTQYAYNGDNQVTLLTRPDGLTVAYGYDTAGRNTTVTVPDGTVTFAWSPVTGLLASATARDGGVFTPSYQGSLPTSATWTGAVAGSVSRTFDVNLRHTSVSVNGAHAVSYTYDADGLVNGAGSMTIARDPASGFITGTSLGSITTALTYDAFAAPASVSAASGPTSLYSAVYTYDAGGRVATRAETFGGATTTLVYGYDPTGNLASVQTNGITTASYTYDANGNRKTGPAAATTGTYDAQDRLVSYGAATYAFTGAGELSTRTQGGQVTTYAYDVLGNLEGVTLPDGTTIAYVVDALNRRIGKKVGGALQRGFLYDSGRLIAELDATSAVVSVFVYGSRVNVPDYMVRGASTLRIVSDILGSPRLVVDEASGTIVQRMDYDEFGVVTSDTNPGFQPFGYAGGIYDPDTHLVRFGARDYDAEAGRWTAHEPLLFAGGHPNLYTYAGGDPINYQDPSGYDDTATNAVVALDRNHLLPDSATATVSFGVAGHGGSFGLQLDADGNLFFAAGVGATSSTGFGASLTADKIVTQEAGTTRQDVLGGSGINGGGNIGPIALGRSVNDSGSTVSLGVSTGDSGVFIGGTNAIQFGNIRAPIVSLFTTATSPDTGESQRDIRRQHLARQFVDAKDRGCSQAVLNAIAAQLNSL